jgi:hypothetical protein
LSESELQENGSIEDQTADLESQLVFDAKEIAKWIERLPADIKAALQHNGGALLPSQAAADFHFPDSLAEGNKEIIDAFGNGGRLWLLARIFKLTWPYSGVLAKNIFDTAGIGEVLQEELMKLREPIAVRMMRFLLSCKEFRQAVQALSMIPDVDQE